MRKVRDARTQNREIIAHHEAGHAVVAFRLGVAVACVTIEPFAGREGIVWHKRADHETEILISLAGPFAEHQFTGTYLCAGDDEANIQRELAHLPEPRENYEAKAAALVRENWEAIEALAFELLLGAGRIYGEHLHLVIR
jgi:hypothetical protein